MEFSQAMMKLREMAVLPVGRWRTLIQYLRFAALLLLPYMPLIVSGGASQVYFIKGKEYIIEHLGYCI